MIEALQHPLDDVNGRFVAAQDRQTLVRAILALQDGPTRRARRGVGANSARFRFGQPTEGGRLQLTG